MSGAHHGRDRHSRASVELAALDSETRTRFLSGFAEDGCFTARRRSPRNALVLKRSDFQAASPHEMTPRQVGVRPPARRTCRSTTARPWGVSRRRRSSTLTGWQLSHIRCPLTFRRRGAYTNAGSDRTTRMPDFGVARPAAAVKQRRALECVRVARRVSRRLLRCLDCVARPRNWLGTSGLRPHTTNKPTEFTVSKTALKNVPSVDIHSTHSVLVKASQQRPLDLQDSKASSHEVPTTPPSAPKFTAESEACPQYVLSERVLGAGQCFCPACRVGSRAGGGLTRMCPVDHSA
jgi:hypothetical protein